jgi:hypothetical protein
MTKIDTNRYLITSRDQLPDFDMMTEDEEMEFWETHDFAEGVLESGPEVEKEFDRLVFAQPE